MKIAFLTERLKLGFGVDLVVDQQARLLSEMYGNYVTVFAIDIDNTILDQNYSVYKAQIPLFFNPIKQDWAAFNRYSQYRTLLMTFDVVVIHTPTFHSWIPLLKADNIKVVVYYYGNSPSFGYSGFRKYRQQILNSSENNLYFPYADKIFTISEYLKNELPKRRVRTKTTVSYLGKEHALEHLQTANSLMKQNIRSYFFLKPDTKIIMYIGRLDPVNNPYKNSLLLIRLQKKLVEHGVTNFKIVAFGLAENESESLFLKNEVLVVQGAVNSEVMSALSSSAVYISPSLWEGFNLPLLEAQALGVPVVAFDLAAHPEVVDKNKSGFLVENENEFFEKTELLLTDESLNLKMRKKALIHSKKFSWVKNVSDLAEYLESLKR